MATATRIGNWHYDRALAPRHGCKKWGDVLRTLADVVSKNGNLLLSAPVRGDRTIGADESTLLQEMAAWMSVNGEAIFGTRPWAVYGEGPSTTARGRAAGPSTRGGDGAPRWTCASPLKGSALRHLLDPTGEGWYGVDQTLPSGSPRVKGETGAVRRLRQDAPLVVTRDARGLTVTLPAPKPESAKAPVVLKIALGR